MTIRSNPERMAWLVLLGSFGFFCFLNLACPLLHLLVPYELYSAFGDRANLCQGYRSD